MALKKSAFASRIQQLAQVVAAVDPSSNQYQPLKGSVRVAAANIATASSNTAVTLTYAAAGAGVSHVITGVAVSYVGGSASGGNVKVKDGTTTIFDLDMFASGQQVIPFNPPLKGTPGAAMSVVLAAAGSGLVGKINVLGHYTEN